MPAANGIIVKAVIGVIAGSGILGFMGKGIVDNRETNIKEHTEIRKEMMAKDEKLRDKVEKIDDKVDDIRVTQSEVVTILRRLDK